MTNDWLRRMLEYNGYDVFRVRNITDVGHLQNDTEDSGEDKIEHEARTNGRSAYEIAEYYTQQYLADSSELKILPTHVTPTPTEHVPAMQMRTQKLLAKAPPYSVEA